VQYLVKNFPEIDSVIFEAGNCYKTLRQNVFNEYMKGCSELRKPHENMSSKEHSYVGKTLFRMDNRQIHNERYSCNNFVHDT